VGIIIRTIQVLLQQARDDSRTASKKKKPNDQHDEGRDKKDAPEKMARNASDGAND